jgi:hypothetical protein
VLREFLLTRFTSQGDRDMRGGTEFNILHLCSVWEFGVTPFCYEIASKLTPKFRCWDTPVDQVVLTASAWTKSGESHRLVLIPSFVLEGFCWNLVSGAS